MKKFWNIMVSITLVIVIIVIIFITVVYLGKFGHLRTVGELQNYKNATASVVLSHEGELMGKYFSENRTNISYEQIPSHLLEALIATEDIRFYRHHGFDVNSLFRVLIKTILMNNPSSGGGSTITQQLAKNMYGRDYYGHLTILANKTKEIFLARRLENAFSKQEILILYLNTVSFGENVFGIEAAARRFFNKNVEELNIEESAVLIGILKANNYYNPRLYPENAKKRRNVVLGQMKKYKFLKASEADSLINLPMVNHYVNYESGGTADYFLFQVKNEAEGILQGIKTETGKGWNIEEDGLIITTTLDFTLQEYAVRSFHEHLTVMQKRLNDQYMTASGKKIVGEITERELKRLGLAHRANEPSLMILPDSINSGPISVRDSLREAVKLLQAGLLAIDPVTGAVRAWVGGIDFKTQPYDQILARRQLASTFKPLIYAVAFEEGIKPCEYLDNDSIVSGIENWSPENFDHTYGGEFSLAGALIRSMNVPTYNLFTRIGFNKLDSLWQRMGFSYKLDNTPSLAMGTAEGSIKEVAIAYASFANRGFKISPQSIESIKTHDGVILWQNEFAPPTSRIISKEIAQLLSAILQRAVREGTGASMNSVFGVTLPLAGKTGTSQDYADAWFTAFNPSLVIVSRVGASSPAIHFNSGSNGSGSALALPLVGLTLRNVQLNKELRKVLISYFPELPQELADELTCPDFREKTFFDRILDTFRKKDIISAPRDKDQELRKHVDRGKSIFRRLFRKKR